MLYESILSDFWSMGTLAVIGYITISFLGIRCLVVLANLYWNPQLPLGKPKNSPLVSILIPARNEEENIAKTLDSLLQQSYQQFEVVVLDDGSTDRTAPIVKEASAKDARIRLMSGQELPKGWLGKNWACHQLAQVAKGDYFLFIDADVQLQEQCIPSLIATTQRYDLTLLSVFPDQYLKTWGERIAVPIMHELLLMLLPLICVRLFPFPSMSAANGQVMFFVAETYRQKHLHEKVQKEVVEDIAIARLLKTEKMRIGTFLGNGLVNCRMYTGYKSTVDGFSKNLLAGFGGSIVGLFIYTSMLTWGYIGLYALPAVFSLIALGMIVLTNWGLAKLSNQHWLMLMLTHFPRRIAFVQIAWQSVLRHLKKQNEWKGRNVHID